MENALCSRPDPWIKNRKKERKQNKTLTSQPWASCNRGEGGSWGGGERAPRGCGVGGAGLFSPTSPPSQERPRTLAPMSQSSFSPSSPESKPAGLQSSRQPLLQRPLPPGCEPRAVCTPFEPLGPSQLRSPLGRIYRRFGKPRAGPGVVQGPSCGEEPRAAALKRSILPTSILEAGPLGHFRGISLRCGYCTGGLERKKEEKRTREAKPL